MNNLPVLLSETAIEDLTQIGVYIATESRSLEIALNFTGRIERRCQKIGDAPHSGVTREDLGVGIRMVPFERRTVILYRINEDHVDVVNVFYGGRDYDAMMREGRS